MRQHGKRGFSQLGLVLCSNSHKQYGLCKSHQVLLNMEVRNRERESEREAGTQVYSYMREKLQESGCVNGFGLAAAKEFL